VRSWQTDVVLPIRKLRRRLKGDAPLLDKGSAELFRTKIKALELESERLQQEAMFTLSQSLTFESANSVEEAASHNIKGYQIVIGQAFDAAAVDVLLKALRQHTAGGRG
jgi:hypothetical protein